MVLGFVLMVAAFVMDVLESTRAANVGLKHAFRLFPPFCFSHGLLSIALREILSAFDDDIAPGDVLAPHDWKIAGASITFMAGGAVVYFLLVLLIEVRSRGDESHQDWLS